MRGQNSGGKAPLPNLYCSDVKARNRFLCIRTRGKGLLPNLYCNDVKAWNRFFGIRTRGKAAVPLSFDSKAGPQAPEP